MLQRYRTFLIIALLLLFALAQIYSADLRGRQQLGFLERVVVSVTSPPQRFLTFLIDRSHQAWLDYIFLVDTRKNYKTLQKDHRQLVMLAAKQQEIAQENIRLRTLLDLKENLPLTMVAARVISFGSSSFTHSVRIDKGFGDGLRAGMPVVTYEGVVGHIINTTKNYANVLLLIDPNSSIDVRNQTTRAHGILQGQGTYDLRVDYLTRQAEIKINDVLITSGLDAIYPKGLTVGTVSGKKDDPSSLFVQVSVKPAVNFSRLEEVQVVTTAKPVFSDGETNKDKEAK